MIQVLFFQTLISYLTICNSCTYKKINNNLYEINPSNGYIVKLDSSNNDTLFKGDLNLFRNHSIVEVVNNKFYRYGGYGYNQTNNKVEYFDSKINKWLYLKLNSFEDHNGIFDGFSFPLNKEIYFFGGKKINELNGMEEITNYDVILLNTKTKSLKKVGSTKLDFSKLIYFSKTSKGLLFRDKLFIYEIDLHSNIIKKYNLDERLMNYNKKDKSLFFNNNKVRSLKSSSTFELKLNDPIDEEKFINEPFNWRPLLPILFLLFVSIYIYKNQRKKIILVNNDSIRYMNKMMLLNSKELKVLKSLLIKNEMSGTEIIDLIENNQITYSKLTRTPKTIIENLNHVLRYLLDKKTDSLVVTKSKIDKRNKVYKLNLDKNIRYKIIDQ